MAERVIRKPRPFGPRVSLIPLFAQNASLIQPTNWVSHFFNHIILWFALYTL